ncbi:MAG: hypothetical protein IJ506_07990 [Clostridia bacterium]|nr:hypothetical protein [Clostridia bacterium]
MVTIYNDENFQAVYNQKKKILGVFWGVTIFYIAFCLAWLVYYTCLPYNDSMQVLPKACVFVASGLYVIFLFPFMGIKYGRVRRYYKMMYYLSEGIKNEEINYFLCFEKKDLQKDFVDVMSCVFTTWNKKKNEWMEREVYFDLEKQKPEFEQGDLVKYVVQSNFIVQYEIVKKHAIEFEYEDEAEEETAEEPQGQETEQEQENENE